MSTLGAGRGAMLEPSHHVAGACRSSIPRPEHATTPPRDREACRSLLILPGIAARPRRSGQTSDAAAHHSLVNNNENTSGKQPQELAAGARPARNPLSSIIK